MAAPEPTLPHWTKGIRAFSWISAEGYTVTFSVPGDGNTIVKNQLKSWSNDPLVLSSANIDGYTGPFKFEVKDPHGNSILSKTNQISTFTGNLQDGSDMTNQTDLQSFVSPYVVITFGFYDAGSGVAGLPGDDQCWVTVTRKFSPPPLLHPIFPPHTDHFQ
jgi:hypothetical protein